MTILAFDQSTTKSGFCLMENDVPKRYGHIDHSDIKNNVPYRIKTMFFDLANMVKQYRPDVLVVEAQQDQGNSKALMMLCQLQGMIISVGWLSDIAVYSPMPVEWRSSLHFRQGRGVKREELKQQALDFVQAHYGINDGDEDAAEAICIATAINLNLKKSRLQSPAFSYEVKGE